MRLVLGPCACAYLAPYIHYIRDIAQKYRDLAACPSSLLRQVLGKQKKLDALVVLSLLGVWHHSGTIVSLKESYLVVAGACIPFFDGLGYICLTSAPRLAIVISSKPPVDGSQICWLFPHTKFKSVNFAVLCRSPTIPMAMCLSWSPGSRRPARRIVARLTSSFGRMQGQAAVVATNRISFPQGSCSAGIFIFT